MLAPRADSEPAIARGTQSVVGRSRARGKKFQNKVSYAECEAIHTPIAISDVDSMRGDQARRCIMIRATVLLFMLLLAACSDQKPLTKAVNEMIESPLQNTVVASFDHYPPRPILGPEAVDAGPP